MVYKVFLCILLPFAAFAQVPAYYQPLTLSLEGEALKNELHELITVTHVNELSYTPGVWDALKQGDINPGNDEEILLFYGWNDTDNNPYNDRTRNRWASCHTSNCSGKWVREHVFPRSKGTPNLGFEGPGSDAHHLHAVDYERNNLRSNYRFAENNTTENGFSKVVMAGGTYCFYPGDEWKGDVARMIMYMYVRYGIQCQPVNAGKSAITYAPLHDMPDIFLEWNVADPVSAHEIQRNEAIYQAQGNRNPFIDNPYLATRIWNGPEAENKWGAATTDFFEKNGVYLYPTVTQTTFTIEGLDWQQLKETEMSVYDLSGKLIVHIRETQPTTDVSAWANGYYFIKLQHTTQNRVFRLIKK